ncbi:MAG: molybdopterin-dependent oxidoreductase, partial [Pseudomonadales bacterium]|nr:molybdopterin-dependent oxidoreductase [Pseudomonadales bacterium]
MHKRICPICEAGCGLTVSTDGRTVTAIAANQDDTFSSGHVCAKGLSLAELDADPDRLRTPLIRRDGKLTEASFEEAFALINDKLNSIIAAHGPAAVATYIGNPTAHNIGMSRSLGIFLGSVGSPNIFSAGTVDQVPKQLASKLMFGDDMAIPVPDLERADLLLMLGANPIVSNGSLWMIPGFRDKLRSFRQRGGTFITIDPRLTETARLANQHISILPGTDALLLGALINQLVSAGLTPAQHYPVTGWDELLSWLAPLTPELAAAGTGIDIDVIRGLGERLRQARSPVVYGRVGTTLQRFGTTTSFLIEVLNLLTGSLDNKGGAVFPEQPFQEAGRKAPGPESGRYHSRVSGRAEVLGQMPVSVLAEEIETPGPGQIRALVTFAGNPVVSNPDSQRLSRALGSLDFMLCIDIYHNETTRMADVVLPGTSPFEDSHYDQFLGAMGHRNVARYSPAIFSAPNLSEWQCGLALAAIVRTRKVPDAADATISSSEIVASAVARYTNDPDSPLFERDVQEIMAMIGPETGVERILDLGIRAGRFGDHFGTREGLTLRQMIENPDGIDLGPPRTNRLAEIINTPSGRLELAPEILKQDIERLLTQTANAGTNAGTNHELLLIGRRGTRTNNSWLGNLSRLGRGSRQCVLEIHPDDAARHGVNQGDWVSITSRLSSVKAMVEVTSHVRAGVVALPHGFSEDRSIRQHRTQTGANYNQLIPVTDVDEPSG